MSKKHIKRAKSLSLLEKTKHRLRLQQEARTIAGIEQLDIEACERLERQLRLEHLELNGELDCSKTDTARQYTLHCSRARHGRGIFARRSGNPRPPRVRYVTFYTDHTGDR